MNRLLDTIQPKSAAAWILANALAWWLIGCLAFGNLDGYGDMIENYAWGQSLAWGSFKHPPLFAWVVGLWFRILPESDAAYYLLSCLNVGVALAGVAVLAKRYLPKDRALLAVALLGLSFPYTTLAFKFNANSILLPLWPWTVVCLMGSMRARRWLPTLGLGLLGAASMLGKYYSGVFLLGLFIASWLTREGRGWWRTPLPWAAGLVFALTLAPHALWLARHDFVTFRYVGEQGDGHFDFGGWLKFAISPLLYWGIGWLMAAALGRDATGRGFGARMLALIKPTGLDDVWFWICWLPLWITLIFGITGFVELSLPWAIPLGYALPLLWLSRPGFSFDTAPQRVARGLTIFWLVALPGAAAYQAWSAWHGKDAHYLPRRELAQAVQARWTHLRPDARLDWAAGEWPEVATLAFYAEHHPRALPSMPDTFPASVAPLDDWSLRGGVLFCQGGQNSACTGKVESWLGDRGLSIRKEVLTVQRSGWRFPKARPHSYTVYWYWPENPLITALDTRS